MRRAVIRAMRKRIIRRTVVATLAAVALLLSVVSLAVTLCVRIGGNSTTQSAPTVIVPAAPQDAIPPLTPESGSWLRNKSLTEAIEQAAGVKFVKNEAGEVNTDLEANQNIIASLTELDLFEKELHSLEGIGLFTSLQILNCSNNQLTTLDLSANHALITLNCYNNSLPAIDLSQCPSLTTLNCSGNSLPALDLSQCPLLTSLNCYNNQLSTLDLSANKALRSLTCTGNHLALLDLTSAPDNIRILCGYQKDATLHTFALTLRESQRPSWEKTSFPDAKVVVTFIPDNAAGR